MASAEQYVCIWSSLLGYLQWMSLFLLGWVEHATNSNSSGHESKMKTFWVVYVWVAGELVKRGI